MKRRIAAVLLALCMCIGLLPATALAAEPGPATDYVTVSNGGLSSMPGDVVIEVVDSTTGNILGRSTITANRTNNTMTIALIENLRDTYDIERVEFVGVWGSSLSEDSFTISSWSNTYGNEFTVYLCPEFEAPYLPDGEIKYGDNGDFSFTRHYRLYEDQILKMLHANKVDVSVNTEIVSVQPTWVNSFSESYRGFDDENLADEDYWNLTVTGVANLDEVQPDNIRKLTITYDNGNGKQTIDIYSGDLRYPVETGTAGVTEHYNIELKDDTFHIVYFYDVEGVQTTIYSLYDIVFVEHNGIVGDEMPAPPIYPDTARYEFVAWTEDPDGGQPFLATTPVTEDTTVYAQKALTTSKSPQIRVMNNGGLLVERLTELFGEEFQMDSVQITVHGTSGVETNPDYDIGLYENGWRENNRYYFVYNYLKGATAEQYNNPVHINDIDKIIVTAKDMDGNELDPVEIQKGEYDGEFWVSTGKYGSDMVIELYINDNNVKNPDTPDPDPDPAITDFTKTLVSSADNVPAGITADNYDYPDPENGDKVIIPYGESVTLLYAITVEGKGGTDFTVTDKGAKLVSTGTDVTGDAGTFTGTIPTGQGDEEGTITFYVSKTFTAEDLGTNDEGDQVLTNTARITTTDEGGVEEGKDDAEEDTPAEEESHPIYVYVQFLNKTGGTNLTPADKAEIEKLYGGTVNNDGYVAIGTFEIPMPDPAEEPYAPDQSGTGAGGPNVIDTELWQAVEGDLIEANFTPKTGITIDLDDVEKWIKLSTAHGAENFDVESEIACWHLDGQIQLYDSDIKVVKTLTHIEREDGTTIEGSAITAGMALEVGDKLTWTITVTNTGNAAATGLTISDKLVAVDENGKEDPRTVTLTNAEGTEVGSDYTFTVAKAGEEGNTVTFTATYTVQKADKGLTLTNTATVSDGDGNEEDEGDTENPVADRKVEIKKELTSATRDGVPVGDLTDYKAQVGDVLSYTITVTNEGNTELTGVKVTDSMWVGTEYAIKVNGTDNYAGADGFTIKDGIAVDGSVTITYTYTVQDSDVEAGKIKNTAGVYLPGDDEPDPGEEPEPDDEDDVTVEMDDYTIDIEPANITIYTGGTGYAGVLENADGTLLTQPTESGLPQPGYHIELPEAVNAWLTAQGVDTSKVMDLAKLLHFAYDQDTQQREWGLTYMGVYDATAEGEITHSEIARRLWLMVRKSPSVSCSRTRTAPPLQATTLPCPPPPLPTSSPLPSTPASWIRMTFRLCLRWRTKMEPKRPSPATWRSAPAPSPSRAWQTRNPTQMPL